MPNVDWEKTQALELETADTLTYWDGFCSSFHSFAPHLQWSYDHSYCFVALPSGVRRLESYKVSCSTLLLRKASSQILDFFFF